MKSFVNNARFLVSLVTAKETECYRSLICGLNNLCKYTSFRWLVPHPYSLCKDSKWCSYGNGVMCRWTSRRANANISFKHRSLDILLAKRYGVCITVRENGCTSSLYSCTMESLMVLSMTTIDMYVGGCSMVIFTYKTRNNLFFGTFATTACIFRMLLLSMLEALKRNILAEKWRESFPCR